MIGIYKIISPTKRIYIGQSIDIKKRFKEYSALRNCKLQIKLYRSFLKHGVENHILEIIEECEISELNNRERYWQDFYNVLEIGLNCILTRSKDKTGKASKDTIEKMKNRVGYWKGKKFSTESKIKMSLAAKGKIPVNKGISTFYKHKCNICKKDFETRIKTSKVCSSECRNENNRIQIQKRTLLIKGVRKKPQEHGTVREFNRYKCRCEKCVENMIIYNKTQREKKANVIYNENKL